MIDILTLYKIYELWLYNLQYYFVYLLSVPIDTLNIYFMFLLFFAGILTSLNPCFLSIWTLSISYISSRTSTNFYKMVFLTGLVTSLILVILSINLVSVKYNASLTNIPLFSELILLFISLSLLQIVNFSPFFRIFKIDKEYNSNLSIFLESYLVGFFAGLSSLPCSTPIILIVNFWLSHSISFIISLSYLFIYVSGCIFPFFLIVNIVLNYIKVYTLSSIWNFIISLSGVIILFISILSFLEKVFI